MLYFIYTPYVNWHCMHYIVIAYEIFMTLLIIISLHFSYKRCTSGIHPRAFIIYRYASSPDGDEPTRCVTLGAQDLAVFHTTKNAGRSSSKYEGFNFFDQGKHYHHMDTKILSRKQADWGAKVENMEPNRVARYNEIKLRIYFPCWKRHEHVSTPMFLHIAARAWDHWYTQTWKKWGSMLKPQ